jgi:hypothetical protein
MNLLMNLLSYVVVVVVWGSYAIVDIDVVWGNRFISDVWRQGDT